MHPVIFGNLEYALNAFFIADKIAGHFYALQEDKTDYDIFSYISIKK